MENYSEKLREWVPVVPTSSWRLAWGSAVVSVLLDVVALMIANSTDSLKCSDGWTDAGQICLVDLYPVTVRTSMFGRAVLYPSRARGCKHVSPATAKQRVMDRR